jgi:hypothetical protein
VGLRGRELITTGAADGVGVVAGACVVSEVFDWSVGDQSGGAANTTIGGAWVADVGAGAANSGCGVNQSEGGTTAGRAAIAGADEAGDGSGGGGTLSAAVDPARLGVNQPIMHTTMRVNITVAAAASAARR